MGMVVISGCSGGGKSTLLEELRRRGHRVVEEPGRRIVREELARGGNALPWLDLRAFIARAIEVATNDYVAATGNSGWTFFDRGLVDAVSGKSAIDGTNLQAELLTKIRYYPRMFLAPPWPELFFNDAERRHGMSQAEAEYRRLAHDYPALGYDVVPLPKASVVARADFMLETLGPAPGAAAD